MFKKIIKICSLITISFFIIATGLFTSSIPVKAAQDSLNDIEENSLGIVIEETGDNMEGSKTSMVPDLGDDQAFPFIPGFGKNSGKD